jgi:hypothetical protein
MKDFYTLIGPDRMVEDWILTLKDFPINKEGQFAYESIPAFKWPLLFLHQVPERYLNQDPGFPILLRKAPERNLPEWFYYPLSEYDPIQRERYYRLNCTRELKPSPKVLFLCHDKKSAVQSWEELISLYSGQQYRWVWYGNENEKPDWPLELRMTPQEYLYFNIYFPDWVIDLSFGIDDSYSGLHLFALSQEAKLDFKQRKCDNYRIKQETYPYGKWELLSKSSSPI